MSNAALAGGINYTEPAGTLTASSDGTNVTAAGTIHTKGGWTQLLAATTMPIAGMLISYRPNALERCSIDIGIGAGGSETVLIADILTDANQVYNTIFVPVALPAGTRIAARSQSSVTINLAIRVAIQLVPVTEFGAIGYGRSVTVGFTAGTTRGTTLDGGAVANTFSAYVDLTTNLGQEVRFLYALVAQATAPTASANLLVELALWDGAAYQHLAYCHIRIITASSPRASAVGPIPVHLKQGARIGARIECDSNDAGARTLDLVLLGVG